MRSILVASWAVPPFRYGGISTFVENLALALRDGGLLPALLGLGPQRDGCWLWEGIRVCNVRCDDPHPGSLDIVWRRLPEAIGFDALVLNDYHVFMLARHDVPTLLYFHVATGAPSEVYALGYATAVATNSKLMLDNIVKPNAAKVLDVVRGWRSALGLPEEPRMAVVYPAPPPPPKQRQVPHIVRRLKERGYKVIAVLARAQDEIKNPGIVVKAAKLLAREGMDKIAVVIAGHGREKRPPCSCGGVRVYHLGGLTEEEKWGLLEAVDTAALPSRFEPFGLVALEAVAAGTPVALSRNTGAAEVLPAPTFNPDNPHEAAHALKTLLEDPENTLKMQRNAKIMKRTWRDVANELLELI